MNGSELGVDDLRAIVGGGGLAVLAQSFVYSLIPDEALRDPEDDPCKPKCTLGFSKNWRIAGFGLFSAEPKGLDDIELIGEIATLTDGAMFALNVMGAAGSIGTWIDGELTLITKDAGSTIATGWEKAWETSTGKQLWFVVEYERCTYVPCLFLRRQADWVKRAELIQYKGWGDAGHAIDIWGNWNEPAPEPLNRAIEAMLDSILLKNIIYRDIGQ